MFTLRSYCNRAPIYVTHYSLAIDCKVEDLFLKIMNLPFLVTFYIKDYGFWLRREQRRFRIFVQVRFLLYVNIE